MVNVCRDFLASQKRSWDYGWYVWNVFSPVVFFFLIELHFLNFILLGCAHIHLSVCEHLQRSQGDFLVLASLSTFTWAQSTRFAQQAPLLGPLPVFLSDIDSSLWWLGCSLKDPVHVIITHPDGSLVVYAWEERGQLLKKCYLLRNREDRPPPR